MTSPAQHTPLQLATQLRALGIETGAVLLVHMSYRAVRPVEGGPAGVIDALRTAVGPTGTLVMPSWGSDDDVPFDSGTTVVDESLGITADMFWRLPGVRRSAHPFSFAALGPLADAITADPLPLPPHRLESPVGRVFEHDGQILLLGVGHDANTTIHLAEVLAHVPYGTPKHCTIVANGRPTRVEYRENDHCCERFNLADEWLADKRLQHKGQVGNATARLMRARDVVSVVRERLHADPLLFLHAPDARCAECDEARATVGHIDQPSA
jgi:aminoglycoside N3'-acetyltransferase